MNELILRFNNEAVAKTGEGGTVDYDLYAVAKCLGYAQPSTAVQNFVQRNVHFQQLSANCRIDLKKADERVLYAFLFYSNAPKAQEFQWWVISEVLPAVRRMYEARNAVEQCSKYLLRHIGRCTLESVLELWPKEVVDAALAETPEAYRLLGFIAPSHTGIAVEAVWRILEALDVFDADDNPRPEWEPELLSVPRYADKTPNKRWFALGPKLVEKVLANKALAAPVGLVLQSDKYSENFEVGAAEYPSLPARKDRPTPMPPI